MFFLLSHPRPYPASCFIAHAERNDLVLLFPKSKSLFSSALIAVRPAQWALLRVQRYIF